MRKIFLPMTIAILLIPGCNKTEKIEVTQKEIIETKSEEVPIVKDREELNVTKSTIEEITDTIEISVEYPVFKGKDELNALINTIVQRNLNEFKITAEMFTPDIQDERKHFFQMWETEKIIGDIVSILFSSETYFIGRARGIHGTCASIVYDYVNDRILSLGELTGMRPEEIGKACYEALPEDAVTKDWLLSADEEVISKLPFSLNEEGDITIFFAPDTVAPHAAGEFFAQIKMKK